MRYWFLSVLLFTVIAFAESAISQEEPQYFPGLARDYRSVVGMISEQSELPVRLPSYLAGYAARVEEAGEINRQVYFPYLVDVHPTTYTVSLSTSDRCLGATACQFYSVKAELITATTPDFSNLVEEMKENPGFEDLNLRTLQLGANGSVEGIFLPSRCLAYCTETQVIFDDQGVRYTVGEKAGAADDVVKMANSMLFAPITVEDY